MRLREDVMELMHSPSLVLYLPLYKDDGATFASRDACGHQCTVTGAAWGPQGRQFDGTDDDVVIPHHNAFNVTDFVTMIFWLKWTDNATSQIVLNKSSSMLHKIYIGTTAKIAHQFYDGVTYLTTTSNGGLVSREMAQVALVSNFQTPSQGIKDTYYINGILDRVTTSGAYSAITTSGNLVRLGWASASGHFFGTMGEVMVFNRGLTPQEIEHIYLGTKRRYR
ncbi:MAG: hypothetical protein A2Z29_00545 [Chloroflexi bacterium RBG_16_56_11]|nr:MAG: hypothetical protein A2Z29_00545 [Chloroflexi bacterium RBG_16_56_11]